MRYETLVCDKCHKEARLPTSGWISTKPSKGSATEASPSPTADFCDPNCLVQYFGAIAIQTGLEDAMDAAGAQLSP